MMAIFRTSLWAVCCILCAAAPAAAQEWLNWRSEAITNPDGFKHISGDETAHVIVVSKEALAQASGGDAPKDKLEYLRHALSVLWIDVEQELGQSQTGLWGDAYTEHGERSFAVALLKDNKVAVLVAERGKLQGEQSLSFLSQPAQVQTSQPQPQPPTRPASPPPQAQPAQTAAAEAPEPSAPLGENPPPFPKKDKQGRKYYPGWIQLDHQVAVIRPNDPASPRTVVTSFPAAEVSSGEEAVQAMLAFQDVQSPQVKTIEPLEVSMKLVGGLEHIAFGESVLGDRPAFFMIFTSKKKDSDRWSAHMLEAPKSIYRIWGGVAAVMVRLGVLNNAKELGDEFFMKAKFIPLEDQAKVFESVYQAKMMAYFRGIMTTQMQTLSQMMQFNADLNTETQCALTPGCQIGTGANGEAVMTFP